MIYLNIEQAVEIHKKTVEISGGGSNGVLNTARLESVLEHIQNDEYYPTFEDKLTHLFFSSNKFHCFEDGNKRISISLGAQFLLLNGYLHCSETFLREMENVSYHLATGKIDKDFLKEIIVSILNENELTEEIKLELFNRIENEQ